MPPDAHARRRPGIVAPAVAEIFSSTSHAHDTARRCSTSYDVDLVDEILMRLEGVATMLAAAAMSATTLTPDECASLVKLVDRAQHLVSMAVGGAT